MQKANHIITSIPEHDVPFNNESAMKYLSDNGVCAGLQESFCKMDERIAMRFFICDDSGSMTINDGQKVVQRKDGSQTMLQCTRWDELRDSLYFHCGLAAAANTPCEFRFLNGPQSVVVGDKDSDPDNMGFRNVIKTLEGTCLY